ncbi:Unknown protein [Striga hermonthica]|uniref:Glycine-rich protein n=1 Tax=Striga hermonthica TaxID=68872 RepID=A0A9N7RDD9_STRHE|nr:Unknown protein [Striga hermonthica]
MKPTNLTLLLTILLLATAAVTIATRPDPDGSAQQKKTSSKGGANDVPGMGGFFGPGGGFNVPGFGPVAGGGYGSGFGGPTGGRSKSGIVRNPVTCTEKGPCYKKKLICPKKCFTAYGGSGKGYGYGGGGGSCNIDCKKCRATC